MKYLSPCSRTPKTWRQQEHRHRQRQVRLQRVGGREEAGDQRQQVREQDEEEQRADRAAGSAAPPSRPSRPPSGRGRCPPAPRTGCAARTSAAAPGRRRPSRSTRLGVTERAVERGTASTTSAPMTWIELEAGRLEHLPGPGAGQRGVQRRLEARVTGEEVEPCGVRIHRLASLPSLRFSASGRRAAPAS